MKYKLFYKKKYEKSKTFQKYYNHFRTQKPQIRKFQKQFSIQNYQNYLI